MGLPGYRKYENALPPSEGPEYHACPKCESEKTVDSHSEGYNHFYKCLDCNEVFDQEEIDEAMAYRLEDCDGPDDDYDDHCNEECKWDIDY